MDGELGSDATRGEWTAPKTQNGKGLAVVDATTSGSTRLNEFAARCKAVLRASDTGPLVIAQDVVRIAGEWELYREEAGGLDCTSWLRRELGPGKSLDFFQRRANAVLKLGEACRRKIHHDVAVWLANHIESEEQIKTAMWALMSATKKQRDNCLTVVQAKRVVFKALGVKPEAKAKACSRCGLLEALLSEKGIAIPQ